MGGIAPEIICKQPSETVNLGIDFTNYVASSSITLSTPSVTSVKYNGSSSDLTLGTPTVSGQKVIFSVDGGTHGTKYKVTVTVNTSDGEVLEGDGILWVKND